MAASNTGYRFHRPARYSDLEVVHGVRVQRAVEPHIHASYEIGLIQQGVALIDVRGTSVQVTDGAMHIVNAGDAHAARAGDGGCSFALLYVTPERMRRAAVAVGRGDEPPVFETRPLRDAAAADLLQQLHDALDAEAPTDQVDRLLHELLCMLVERATVPPPEQHPHEATARVKAYIDEHYAEPIALDELARVAGLSKYHLIRVFRATHGMPPHAYQNAVRIARAREALAAGRSAADVAQETGFADQSHFTRRFKRLVGVAPGEYARWSAARRQRRRRS